TMSLFSFTPTPPTALHTLSLHDALPICPAKEKTCKTAEKHRLDRRSAPASIGALRWWPRPRPRPRRRSVRSISGWRRSNGPTTRSEEHTSELQSRFDLVCRLLLEKKNKR